MAKRVQPLQHVKALLYRIDDLDVADRGLLEDMLYPRRTCTFLMRQYTLGPFTAKIGYVVEEMSQTASLRSDRRILTSSRSS